MTQERMNDLYHRGLYSPINYYLGLIALLKAGENLDAVMGGVPQPLLGTILDIAASHTSAEDRATDARETMITGSMLAWKESLSTLSKHRANIA